MLHHLPSVRRRVVSSSGLLHLPYRKFHGELPEDVFAEAANDAEHAAFAESKPV